MPRGRGFGDDAEMPTVLYVTAVEPATGKSLVVLGTMETAAARTGRLGFFRPFVRADEELDPGIELMLRRYRLRQSYEESYGVVADEMTWAGESIDPGVTNQILGKFENLASRCDVIIVDGTDFIGAATAFEFTLNAELAANMGATAMVVSRAHGHGARQVGRVLQAAAESLSRRHVPVLSFFVNRVDPDQVEVLQSLGPELDGAPIWLLPEEPRLLVPTLADIARTTGATVLESGGEGLYREVPNIVIGAMTLPHLMERVEPDSLIVVPGDRAEVILLALASQYSTGLPAVSGLLLTGGYEPHPALVRFARGLRHGPISMLLVPDRTLETVEKLLSISASLTKADDRRIAFAARVFEDHVDTRALVRRALITHSTSVTPTMFERMLVTRARADKRRIVLPEGGDERVLRAAERVLRRDVAEVTILGDEQLVRERAADFGLDLTNAQVVDPSTSEWRDEFAATILKQRERKGMSAETAADLARDPTWFATLMVLTGRADGMVSGATHTTADTVRPALQMIRTAPGTSVVSSVFLMALADRVLVYGDCAVIPNPDAGELADIAISSARTARAFGIDPRVAMLSYSTGSSGSGADVEKVTAATALVREREPDLPVEGPIQYDAAVDPQVGAAKLPGSQVAGHANVLIFPDLNTGNNTYKAVQRTAGAVAIGPVLQGLRLPVNDLSRGATVDDIINTVIITAVQAGERPGGES